MTQLEQAVLDKFRDFRIAFEALCEARYADKDLATTTNHGLMSAADKAKLDSLEKLIAGSGVTISGGTISAAGTYTLPTASTTVKGGIMIGNGLSMNGDSLNVTLQAGSNYVAGTNVTINGNTISAGGSTYSAATTTTSGLMSAADKAKLNNLASITTAGANVTITNGTIKAADTTYSVATTSTNGLMSSTDKAKLNNLASITSAGSNITISGGVISGTPNTTYTAGSNITISGTTISGTANTTYSVATTSANGLMSSTDKAKLNNLASITSAGSNITISNGVISGTANTTYSKFTTTANGLVPSPGSANTSKYLRGDGTWAAPSVQMVLTTVASTTNGAMWIVP